VSTVLNALQILRSKQQGGGLGNVLTLPRIAIAFCRTCLEMRVAAGARLKKQFPELQLPVEFQDVATVHLAPPEQLTNAKAYHAAMSRALSPKVAKTDDEINRWWSLSHYGILGDIIQQQVGNAFVTAWKVEEVVKRKTEQGNAKGNDVLAGVLNATVQAGTWFDNPTFGGL
jgi:hypothetical protein